MSIDKHFPILTLGQLSESFFYIETNSQKSYTIFGAKYTIGKKGVFILRIKLQHNQSNKCMCHRLAILGNKVDIILKCCNATYPFILDSGPFIYIKPGILRYSVVITTHFMFFKKKVAAVRHIKVTHVSDR